VHIVVVNFGDIRVCDYDEGEVSKGLNAVGEASWEDIEGEIGGTV